MREKGQSGLPIIVLVLVALVGGVVGIKTWKDKARPPALAWQEGAPGFAVAEQQQAERNAPMLVYFHTEWCGYCKRFERELLPSAAVQQYLGGVVKVRLNPERSPEERALGDRYGVRGYPSMFMQRGGEPVRVFPFTQAGGRWNEATPEEFVAQLQRAASAPVQ